MMRVNKLIFGMTVLPRLRALLAAVVLSLSVAACGESVELVGSLPESEANEILSTLLREGIEVQKVPAAEGLVSVMVDGSRVADALHIMRANGLPREQFARMGDVFQKEGLISSPLEERARYIYALSQGLAETISQIDGVITARVHVVLPDRAPGAGAVLTPSSAAVFIKYKEAYSLDAVVPQIKRLVTNSISNLNYDNVSVVLVPSMTLAPTVSSEAAATVSLFGLQVAPDARPVLAGGLVILMVLTLAAAGSAGTMYWMWKIRPKQRQEADAES